MKKITAIILFIFALATTSHAADKRILYTEKMVGANHPTLTDTLNRLSIVEHNNDGTHKYVGSSNIIVLKTGDGLNAAITSAGTNTVTFRIIGTVTLSSTVTSSENISYIFESPGNITRTAGTLTIKGSITAGLYQIFVSFSPGEIEGLFEANPIWFGAHSVFETGYSTFDSSTAINTASASFGNKGILYFPKGKFRVDSKLSKKPGVRWIGVGADFDDITAETESWVGTTLLWSSSTGTLVEVLGGNTVTADRMGAGSYWHGGFEHISFKGIWAGMVDAVAIAFPGSKKEYIKNCDIRYFGRGIRAEFYDSSYAGEIVIRDTYMGYMKDSSISMYKTVDCYIENSLFGGDNYGLDLDNCNAFEIDTVRAQNGQVAGMRINNSMNIKIKGGWIDTNGDATHTADGAVVTNSNDITFNDVTFYDNTGNGVVFKNSHEFKIQGCSFGRMGQVGPINSSGIVIMSDSSIGTGDTYRVSILGNFFTVDPYERDFTGRGTLERGILVTNATLTTDVVRQLSIIGNDFFTETALHLENSDVVSGNTSNLTTGIFAYNNITGVTNDYIIRNPSQISTKEFQYSRDWQTPAPAAITTKGDEDLIVSLYGNDAKVYQFASPLTTTRTVTLSDYSPIGSTVEILRTGASTGSSLLTVKKDDGTTVENLGTNQWMKAVRVAGSQVWARISSGSTTPLFATTSTFNAGLLSAGTCTTRTQTIANAAVGQSVTVTPTTYPGDGVVWDGYISAAQVVTYRLCALASAVTPSVTTYRITVLK